MKKHHVFIIVLVLLLAACSSPTDDDLTVNNNEYNINSDNVGGESNNGQPTQTENSSPNNADNTEEIPVVTSGPDCYVDGEHPIAESIAEQFEEITTYDEIMTWFCSGAYFEDILNALMTEEMVEADADELLHMLAAGKTWDEIWLELGITEE
jgi:hypothetical protein